VIGWTDAAGPPLVDSVYADYLAGAASSRGLLLLDETVAMSAASSLSGARC
jgi:hypothetical protein